MSFDSDLGFEFGAPMNLYDYGDGSKYPNFQQSLYMEASYYTKGSGIFRVNYDTRKLIKGIRVYADLRTIFILFTALTGMMPFTIPPGLTRTERTM